MTSSTVAAAIAPVASANLVIAVARFATSIDAAQLDGAVIQAVKTNMLDTLSCALAGSSARPIAEVSGLVREWGGAPQADIFVFGHFSDEALQRADILELASRVKPYVDEEIDRDWRRFVTPGRVIVRFRDGQTLEAR